MVREVLKQAMGTTNGTKTKVHEPLAAGQFWTHDDPTHPERMLRPNWDSWSANDVWVPEMIKRIKVDGPKYCPVDREEFANVPEKVLHSALRTAWTSMKDTYRLKQKPKNVQDDVQRSKRHNARKDTVCLTYSYRIQLIIVFLESRKAGQRASART